jgi:TolB-like protein/thioredoxin-like negative regulator of GroEL
MSKTVGHVYQFGNFRLDTGECILVRKGEVIPLTRKAFETLAFLVENSGRTLRKEDMIESIWPDRFVEDGILAQNIFTLRRALGDQAHYIETVPRRGYRFVSSVTEVLSVSDNGASGAQSTGTVRLKSMAVLPFRVLGSDDHSDYLGVGLTDALITRLSNVKDIVVRPTSAVLKYNHPDQDITAAGQELKVELVLSGMIQQAKDRIRVTVQLVNVESGVPLWADKYDEKFSDVFTVQDTISGQVIEALTLNLTSDQKLLLLKRYTKNSEAFRHYLKGRYSWSKWTKEGFKKSIGFFERAIEMEPTYSLAYAGLADTFTSLGFYGYMRPHESMPQVKSLAKKALQLDHQLTEARLPLAAALFFYDWDWAQAEEEFKRCSEANPGYATAHQMYGLFLVAMKRFDEASEMFNRALEADPVSPLIRTTAALPYYYAGEYDRAVSLCCETLDEDPFFGLAHVALADVYLQKDMYEVAIKHYQQGMITWGRTPVLPHLAYAYALYNNRTEATIILAELEQLSSREYVSPLSLAIVWAGLGEKDNAFACLEKACQERCNKLVFLNVEPTFATLRSSPRFDELVKRVGLKA